MLKLSHIRARVRRLITYRYSVAVAERALMRRFSRTKPAVAPADAPLLLVECVEELFIFLMFGEIVSSLRAQGPLRVHSYNCRGLRLGTSNGVRDFVRGFLEINGLSDAKWSSLFGSFSDRPAFAAAQFVNPFRSLSYILRAWRLWRSLESVDQLAALEIDGIRLGDLVIDSFLRFKPSPVVILRDSYLFMVLRQTVKNLDLAQRYFAREKPAIYFTTYTTYIQHGIAVRVALKAGTRVMAVATTTQQVAIEVTADHPTHTKPVDAYPADFAQRSGQAGRLARAHDILVARLSGKIDPAISYMRESAYAVTTTDVPNVRDGAVIFLHDFYDSPHGYRWMLFHEFWDWARFTLAVLTEAGLPVFVKAHPNQQEGSAAELARLEHEFPAARFISSKISNRQLVDAGMKCAVTVHGSIAAEMAFLGVPTISAGDNPHVAFGFCKLARTKDGYRDLLRSFPALDDDPAALREQACMFYYMHNLDLDEDDAQFRDAFLAFWSRIMETQRSQVQDADGMKIDLDRLNAMPGFRQFIDKLYQRIAA